MRRTWLLLLVIALGLCSLGAERSPWLPRRRPDFKANRLAAERVRIEEWPAEPPSPSTVDPDALARGMAQLCGLASAKRARPLVDYTLEAAREFAIDPFLLAALTYRASRCRADKQELAGMGLSLLPPRMYAGGFKGRAYHYRVRDQERWVDKVLALPRYAFVEANLLRAQSNLYFTAGLLAMWREQHDTVDRSFEQHPHRHFISHFVWGDRVRSARAEDRIFGDRRRLLLYYGALNEAAPIHWQGLQLGPPLDGAPRVVSSGLGFARDNGRSHRGIDIESEWGEPVRAIADGKVVFSGVDLPGKQQHAQLPPAQTNAYDRKAFGYGGRYVCIAHEGGTVPLRSCSMHLETVAVAYGDRVTRGQKIGTVGRTGMTRSAPHLHLELLSGELLDGLAILRGHLVGNPLEPGDLEWGEPGSGGSNAF